MSLTRRQQVLGGLFVVVGVLTVAILSRVVGTVFFAITVAYVLYPVRRELSERGVPRQVSAALATAVGFLFALLIVTPLAWALYVRRGDLLEFLREVPPEIPVSLFEVSYVVDVGQLVTQTREAVVSVAVDVASASPVIALKAFLFLLLVYGLLLRPGDLRGATMRIIPGEYHDVALALHRRLRDTLYALYVLQAATAFGTFAIAYVVFWALGFDAAFTLAILSGLLQFVPVLGPSILIALVAAGQVIAGAVSTAVLLSVIGLVFVGFLPDALIRPRLASLTTGMPASLYFVGFVGGTLTLGVVGVIAGPLIVALFVEVVEITTADRTSVQLTLAESMPTDGTAQDTGEQTATAAAAETSDDNSQP
jgi:predicted PurR-regulated permease PerM